MEGRDLTRVTALELAIGARMRTRRRQLGLSQSDLADKLGVSFQQVQKYERGANRVAASTLVAAAVALGYLGFRGLRTGRRSSWRVLAWSFVVALAAEVITTGLVFSRGLPLPGVPGHDRFGWQPVAVGLLAWALGLVVGRPSRTAVHTASSTTLAADRGHG